MPVVPSSLIQSSLLLGGIATALPPGLCNELAVVLHPLAVVGFVGALVNALQLIPIGRLDGGRVCLAVLGQPVAGLVSGLTTFSSSASPCSTPTRLYSHSSSSSSSSSSARRSYLQRMI